MKIAVIGIGCIGKVHVRALKALGEEIVALCDIDKTRAEDCAKANGLSVAVYDDYSKMLDEVEPDAVHVCTPHYLHAPMIIAALNKDINVLTEKPLAISFKELDDIEEAVKRSRAKLGVCLQNRYNEANKYVKKFFEGKNVFSGVAQLCWQRDKAYYDSGEWRGKRATEGGGVMINQAIHYLDMLEWVCGVPLTVKAYTFNCSLENVIEVEDTAFGVFTLPNGGNFIINATNASKYSYGITTKFASDNDVLEFSAENIILNGEFLTRPDGAPVFGKEEWGCGHMKLFKDFYDCIQSDRPFPIDFYEGSKSIRLVLKMYESNGKEIAVE